MEREKGMQPETERWGPGKIKRDRKREKYPNGERIKDKDRDIGEE